jgi:hypothetical protein
VQFSFRRTAAKATVNVFMRACRDCGAITGLKLSTEDSGEPQGMDTAADHAAWHAELEQRLKGKGHG